MTGLMPICGNTEDLRKKSHSFRLNTDMFFFVTSGASDLTEVETCVVEAAAQLHYFKRIFVIFVGGASEDVDVMASRTLSVLVSSYENVYLRRVRLATLKYFPHLQDWLIGSDFQKSAHFDTFLREAMAYEFLDKFGGTALDFDVLLLQTIKSDSTISR